MPERGAFLRGPGLEFGHSCFEKLLGTSYDRRCQRRIVGPPVDSLLRAFIIVCGPLQFLAPYSCIFGT